MKQKKWKPWLGILLGLVTTLLLGVFNFTIEGRLISANLLGQKYVSAASEHLFPTAQSTSEDLSILNVDFSNTSLSQSELLELIPSLSKVSEVKNGLLNLRGVPERAGWYSDRSGPFVYRIVTGDFMVQTKARAVKAADGSTRPTGRFNSAGLLVRDASSSKGDMRWLMYNLGYQASFYGTEAKNTVPDIQKWHVQRLAGFHSASTFWLTPLPENINEAVLRICRIGNEFRFFKKLPSSDQWIEEAYQNSTQVNGNGVTKPTKGVVENGVIRFIRDDMPQTVQVGLIVNPGMPPHDGIGQFTGIKFERIQSFNQCK